MNTKTLIHNSEQRLMSWKTLLQEAYQYKMSNWYKDMLRDFKNQEERFWKNLVAERQQEKMFFN